MELTRLPILICVCLILAVPSTYAAIKAGEAAPDFTLQTTAEETVSLSDYKGKIVILHFWKSN